MAELIEALAEAKIQASEVKELLQEKDGQIAELKKALEMKDRLLHEGDAYYEINDTGNPIGHPYCSPCWEIKHSAIHLTLIAGGFDWNCPACKTSFSYKSVQVFS